MATASSQQSSFCIDSVSLPSFDLIGEDRNKLLLDTVLLVEPSNTNAAFANPYFPLIPELVKVFEAEDEIIRATVTGETRDKMVHYRHYGLEYCRGKGQLIEVTDINCNGGVCLQTREGSSLEPVGSAA